MAAHDLSDVKLLTSGSLDFTSTGVKWKFPHFTSLRIKRFAVLLSAAPGDAGTVELRKVNQAGTATVLATIELLTTHAADDLVYAALVSGSSALPIVTAEEHLDVNVLAASASVSAEYAVVEFSLEPSPSAPTNTIATT